MFGKWRGLTGLRYRLARRVRRGGSACEVSLTRFETRSGEVLVGRRGCAPVQGERTERREQHGVAGNLKAELDERLHRDSKNACDGAEPNPVSIGARRLEPLA